MSRQSAFDVTPSASRLTSSLRDIGYDFVAAVADLVDNSIAAGSSNISIELAHGDGAPFVLIADDGQGMTFGQLQEALRFGSRRAYAYDDLGRYGLGLKTASISQCRRVSVISRRSAERAVITSLSLDLDHVERVDRWEVVAPLESKALRLARQRLQRGPGTVVLWESLDRVLQTTRPESGYARRKLETLAFKTREHLEMVFHRFIEGSAGAGRVHMSVNGTKARPWNPFAPREPNRIELPSQTFEIDSVGGIAPIQLHRYVLPPRDRFSSHDEFERLAGPQKWNRQQGLYIYRADRLIQAGGWSGIRAADEHTKYARASLDFHTTHDPLFQINVAKMRVTLPSELRAILEKPLLELSHHADAVYRKDFDPASRRRKELTSPQSAAANEIAAAIIVAAISTDTYEHLSTMIDYMRSYDPLIAKSLGW